MNKNQKKKAKEKFKKLIAKATLAAVGGGQAQVTSARGARGTRAYTTPCPLYMYTGESMEPLEIP